MIGAGTESRWQRWRVTLCTLWGMSLTRRTTSRTSRPRAWPSGRPRTQGRLLSNLTQSTPVTWTCRPPRRLRSSLNHCDLPSLVLRFTEQECRDWTPITIIAILSFELTEIIPVLFIYGLVRCEMLLMLSRHQIVLFCSVCSSKIFCVRDRITSKSQILSASIMFLRTPRKINNIVYSGKSTMGVHSCVVTV